MATPIHARSHIPSRPHLRRKREYIAPSKVPRPANTPQSITVSLPRTNPSAPLASQPLPQEAVTAFRSFLSTLFPPSTPFHALSTRPFSHTRICWYSDTPTGDWLITYHPSYSRSLFVATG